MKALVLNAFERKGVSKKTGEPYTSYHISIALPFNPVDFGSYKETGYGVNVAELPLEPSALPKFYL